MDVLFCATVSDLETVASWSAVVPLDALVIRVLSVLDSVRETDDFEGTSVKFVEQVMVESSGPGIVGTTMDAFRLMLKPDEPIVDAIGSSDWLSATA